MGVGYPLCAREGERKQASIMGRMATQPGQFCFRGLLGVKMSAVKLRRERRCCWSPVSIEP